MPTAPGVGVEFAGYSIERVLGRGGGGLVYLAKDLRLSRHVALKILAAELADDPRFRERFVRESRLAASIDHHNIIPIYAADEVDGVLFIAMRYVAGTDLRKLLTEEGTLDPERALAIVAQVGDALDVAHAENLVHRDVKPGNVLIVPRLNPSGADHAYLADFGITKRVTTDHSLTGAGQFVGTTDYVAPEQIMGGKIDGRADLYSLGCVFYQCLVGAPPFERDSDVAVIYAHLSDVRPLLSSHRPELPQALDEVVAKAMAKEPDDRYPTAAAFVAAARAALQQGTRGAATTVGPGAVATQVATRAPLRGVEPQPTAAAAISPTVSTTAPPDSATQTALPAPPGAPLDTATQTALPAPPAAAHGPPPAYVPVVAPAPAPSRAPSGSGHRLAIVIAAVLVLAAGGGVAAVVLTQHGASTPSGSTGATSPPASNTAPSATPNILGMLLTANDFPAGQVTLLPTSLLLSQVRCGADPTNRLEEHNVAFEDRNASTGQGDFYFQATASFSSIADAGAYLDKVNTAVQGCTVQVTPAPSPVAVGDRSIRVVFPSGDDTITYDALYFSKGRFVTLVMVSRLGTTPPQASLAGTYAFVAAAHMKNSGA